MVHMVKVTNAFGDVYRGKCHNAVYQLNNGVPVRRLYKEQRESLSPRKIAHNQKFKDAVTWINTLTSEVKLAAKQQYQLLFVPYKQGYPANWYNWLKQLFITNIKFNATTGIRPNYNVLHPSIMTIKEYDAENNVLFELDNLTDLISGKITSNFSKQIETETTLIKVTTFPGISCYYCKKNV